ncbi:hypothetical protein [Streptomyces pactum]|uniref:hypothetical protein n=1 Tax=Streptomyces pactum TaxID=68249 RepID=UPI00370179C0
MHRSPRTAPGVRGRRRPAAALAALVAALVLALAVAGTGAPGPPAGPVTAGAAAAQHLDAAQHADDGSLPGPTARVRLPRDPLGERTTPPGHHPLPPRGAAAVPPGPVRTAPATSDLPLTTVPQSRDRGRAPPVPPGS